MCNGVLYCNKQHVEGGQISPKCEVNPKTKVECPQSNNKTCHDNICQKATGECAQVAAKAGAACSDGNACTPNDTCDDKSACQPDSNNTCACESDADCGEFDDKDACNGSLFCDKSGKDANGKPLPVCRLNPASVVNCKAANNTACKQELCNPVTGKCALNFIDFEGKACSDSQPCTVNDICKAGECEAGANLCDCVPGDKDLTCDKFEDGNLCNGVLYCDAKSVPHKCKVNASTVIACPNANDNYCQKNTCALVTGKCAFNFLHVDEPCDDGDKCTSGEVCKAGICAVAGLGGADPCDDKNACTKDSCDKAQGCLHASLDSQPCDDGNACTSKDTCQKGTCNAGSKKDCDDGNACTTDTCNIKSGCLAFNNSDACEDGDKCTQKDHCVAGKCESGTPLACQDSNPCSLDTCDKATGSCKYESVSAAVVCDDGLACTTEACNSVQGCSYAPVDSKCGDGLDCTTDRCALGKGCQHEAISGACDKGEPCRVYACELGKGCVSKPQLDGSACSDGKNCTFPDACKAGACVAGPVIQGCNVDPAQCKGKADGAVCNTSDKCSTGACYNEVCRPNIESVHMRLLAGRADANSYDGLRGGAYFNNPQGVAVDGDGLVYVADYANHAIRRVDLAGNASLYAGPTRWNSPGADDGPVLGASFRNPTGLDVNKAKIVWVADYANHRIRAISAGTSVERVVSTVAGSGTGFADGKGVAAKFKNPADVAFAADGKSAYVADYNNHRVRKVLADGTVTTLAGSGASGAADGTGTAATLAYPTALAVGPKGNVFVVGTKVTSGRVIRRITPAGVVTTLAGGGTKPVNGKGAAAGFADMWGIAVDAAGVVFTLSEHNYGKTVRMAQTTPDGTVSTVFWNASNVNAWVEGDGTKIVMYYPKGIALGPTGDLVVAGGNSNRIGYIELRRNKCDDGSVCTSDVCDAQTGTCSALKQSTCGEDSYPCHTTACDAKTGACTYTYLGDGKSCADASPCSVAHNCQDGRCNPAAKVESWAGTKSASAGSGASAVDGTLAQARFNRPLGLGSDEDGNIWVADSGNHIVRKITEQGEVHTVAGSYAAGAGFADGVGLGARFSQPADVACAGGGGVFVADQKNHRVRRIGAGAQVTTVAGSTAHGYKDGPAAEALLYEPIGLSLDRLGVLYIADYYNHRIRTLSASGTVGTLSGNSKGYRDGPANVAQFNYPVGLDAAEDGSLYVADSENHAIRRVLANGFATTVAGGRTYGFRNEVGAGGALFVRPFDIAVDAGRNIYVADYSNNAIRFIPTSGRTTAIAGGKWLTASTGYGAVDAIGGEAKFYSPASVLLVPKGLLVSDAANHRLRLLTLPNKSCDDANACTADACVNDQGCVHPPLGADTSCDDGSACTVGDGCSGGACKAGPLAAGCKCKAGSAGGCDDANACTADGCDATTGCYATPLTDGTPCDDGNKCTEDEDCRAGKCSAALDKWTLRPWVTANTRRDGHRVGINGGRRAQLGTLGPTGIVRSGDGDVYVADAGAQLIRKIGADGWGTSIAGFPSQYYNAGLRDSTALGSKFSSPTDLAIGPGGDVFVADSGNHRVRRVSGGYVTTFAGSSSGYADGKGAQAKMNKPLGITADPVGNLYVADYNNCAIRKVAPDASVTTVVGGVGKCSQNAGTAAATRLYYPHAVTFGPDGYLYVATAGHLIMRMTTVGVSEMIVGNAGGANQKYSGFADGIAPLGARFYHPRGMSIDATGNIYVADRYNRRVRMITAAGNGPRRVVTIAGTGTSGYSFGMALKSKMNEPLNIATIADGKLLVTDYGNRKIMLLTRIDGSCDDANPCTIDKCDPKVGCSHTKAPDAVACPDGGPCALGTCDANKGTCTYAPKLDGAICDETGKCRRQCYAGGCHSMAVVTAVIGNGSNVDKEGAGTEASIKSPIAMTWGSDDQLYVVSYGGHAIYRADKDMKLTKFTGGNGYGYVEGGPAQAKFYSPWDIVADKTGMLYVADSGNNRIRRVTKTGAVATLAGLTSGYADGTATLARFKQPVSLALAADGQLTVSDYGNHCLRKIDPTSGKVTTFAGKCQSSGWQDGKGNEALFLYPVSVSHDDKGIAFVADGSHSIRRVGLDGTVTTVAGHYDSDVIFGRGRFGSSFYQPHDVLPLPDGTLLVSGRGRRTLRRVWPDGTSEVAAARYSTSSGDADGFGPEVRLGGIIGLARNPKTGQILAADFEARRIKQVDMQLTSCADLRGISKYNAGKSCKGLQPLVRYSDFGNYWVDVDGAAADNAFRTRCDMSTAGGGWTRVDAAGASAQVVDALRGSLGKVMYKCTDTGPEHAISPSTKQAWSWSAKATLPGTWMVGAVGHTCGADKSFEAIPCGFGWGCADAPAADSASFLPGITGAGKQCGDTTDAHSTGALSICAKNGDYKDYRVYIRSDD